MPSVVKYGRYWISAGILITGAIWLARPGDPRVMGEDTADIFEQVQEMLLVPYQYGTQVPDFYGYNIVGNAYPSNSISSEIKYQIIQNMADRVRYITTRSDTAIFWTKEFFGDTATLALSHGQYATALSSGVSVDYLNGGGWNITNMTYSYSTNSFSDSIVTSASRMWTNGCQFEIINPIDEGDDYSTLTLSWTNLPLANLVFGRGSATAITNASSFSTPGSAWPFSWSYSFPWEQWNTPSKSRVTVSFLQNDNITFTNFLWISASSLTVTNSPTLIDTLLPGKTKSFGFCVGSLTDVYGNDSVEFAVIKTPTSNNGIVLPQYSYTLSRSYSWTYITISKSLAIQGEDIAVERVYGDTGMDFEIVANELSFASLRVKTDPGKDNNLTILKFTSTDSQAVPAYCAFSFTPTVPNPVVLTNVYFSLSKKLYLNESIIATATTNAIATDLVVYNDKRITTNKLNCFAQVLTNLNQTVCIGARSLLSCTGLVQVVQSHGLTNYLTEFLYGEGTTPSFFTDYTRNDLVDDFSIITEVSTNTSSASGAVGNTAEYLFSFFDQGWSTVSTNALIYDWWSDTEVEGNIHERKNNTWLGCSPSYPSLWALTNGLVNKVTIYAAMEVVKNISDSYLPWDLPSQNYYKHSSSGEYWHEGNFGVLASNLTINLPSHSVDASRTNGLHKVFPGGTAYDGNFWFTDTAVFSKIYETNSPTGPIAFDWQCPTITHADPKQRYAYFSYETAASGDRDLYREWHYRLGYRVLASRIMIVVDWDFKYLGRGFAPATNTPAGRQ